MGLINVDAMLEEANSDSAIKTAVLVDTAYLGKKQLSKSYYVSIAMLFYYRSNSGSINKKLFTIDSDTRTDGSPFIKLLKCVDPSTKFKAGRDTIKRPFDTMKSLYENLGSKGQYKPFKISWNMKPGRDASFHDRFGFSSIELVQEDSCLDLIASIKEERVVWPKEFLSIQESTMYPDKFLLYSVEHAHHHQLDEPIDISEEIDEETDDIGFEEFEDEEPTPPAPTIDFNKQREELRRNRLKNAFKRLVALTDRKGDLYSRCNRLFVDYDTCRKADKEKFFQLAQNAISNAIKHYEEESDDQAFGN